MTTNSSTLTPLQQKLAARKPHRKTIDLPGVPGIDGEKVTLQILRKGEASFALAAAYARVDKHAEKIPALRDDKDFVGDLKTIAVLHQAVRDAKDPDACPAFVSPEWMEERLAPAELSALLSAYNAFVAEVYPAGTQHLEPHRLLALLELCAENAGTDIPNEAMLTFSREVLAEMVVRAAVLWKEARDAAVEAEGKLARLVNAGVVPPEEGAEEGDGNLSVYAIRLMARDHGNDLLALSAPRIRTARDAALAMTMLGWKEGSPAWRAVLGEESEG
jgi:hypothetical protein